MSKEKRLGRGLEALLGKVAQAQEENNLTQHDQIRENPTTQNDVSNDGNTEPSNDSRQNLPDMTETPADEMLNEMMKDRPSQEISIELIDRNPYQPRLDFEEDELNNLAASLEKYGMIQPVVLRRNQERFELIAGERRLRAASLAGWSRVPAHILVVEDREMAELALTENMQRKDLNAIEKAVAFRNYLDTYGGTHEELAKRLELERSTVTNLLRLLDLADELQTAVRQGILSQGHARALLPLEEWAQHDVAQRILQEGWSVRQTEAYVQELLSRDGELPSRPVSQKRQTAQSSPQIRELEQQFRSRLGTKVQLIANERGKGKLVIQFNSNDEFERVYQLICPIQ